MIPELENTSFPRTGFEQWAPSPGMSTRTYLIGRAIGPILLKLMSREKQPGYTDKAAMAEAMRLAVYCVDSLPGI